MRTMETKALACSWKADQDDANVLVGYASTFGKVDLGGDVVLAGAFVDALVEINDQGIPLLADHRADTASVLGTILEAREDAKGLVIQARFSCAASAQEVRTKLREGHLSKLSIGYEPIDFSYEERDGKTVRVLKQVRLWEVSVVVFPMNTEAAVTSAKASIGESIDDALRGAEVLFALAYAEARK